MNLPALPRNPRRLENKVVKMLIELKEMTSEYPPELYVPRRDAYLAQVETQKCPGRLAPTRAVTDQSGTL
jgi:hypothetical protein